MQVCDKEMVLIGGIKQYIQVEGNDEKNPLLLMLHGGPGSPFSVISPELPEEYQENFLLVNWDQEVL